MQPLCHHLYQLPMAEKSTKTVLSSPLYSLHVPAVPAVSAAALSPNWPAGGVTLAITWFPWIKPAAEVSWLQFVTGDPAKLVAMRLA